MWFQSIRTYASGIAADNPFSYFFKIKHPRGNEIVCARTVMEEGEYDYYVRSTKDSDMIDQS
jgi:hypothetical protein